MKRTDSNGNTLQIFRKFSLAKLAFSSGPHVLVKQPKSEDRFANANRIGGFVAFYDDEKQQPVIALLPPAGSDRKGLSGWLEGLGFETGAVDFIQHLPVSEHFSRLYSSHDRVIAVTTEARANSSGFWDMVRNVDQIEGGFHNLIGVRAQGEDTPELQKTIQLIERHGLIREDNLPALRATVEVMSNPDTRLTRRTLKRQINQAYPI